MHGDPAELEIVPIVAVARGRVIGRSNTLPWRLSEDLRRFKALTIGHPIVMGRKTFESIGRVLPDRLNIVVSRRATFEEHPALFHAHSLQEALDRAGLTHRKAFIIGGAEIYSQSLPLAHRIELTLIATDVPGGDAFFPSLGREWHGDLGPPVDSSQHGLDGNPLTFSFTTLTRRADCSDCDLCRVREGRFGALSENIKSPGASVVEVLRAITSAQA